jgi:hypothetical protein
MMKKMTFMEWCQLNGRRWEFAATYEEFEKNAKDYETYLSTTTEGGA